MSTVTVNPPDADPAWSSPAPGTAPQQYDAVAEEYDREIRPRYEPIAALVRDRLLELLDPRDADVVELSAGTGALTHQLAPRSGRYTATDVSQPMLSVGHRRAAPGCEHVEWVVSDVHSMVLPSHSADALVSSLGPFQDSDTSLREARRVLRPGGRLVACTWGDSYRELTVLQEARARLGMPPRPVTTAAQLRERLTQAGFDEIEIRQVRRPVVHESVAAYLTYRQSFGPLPDLSAEEAARVLDAVGECASRFLDEDGRVALDWHLLVMSACA